MTRALKRRFIIFTMTAVTCLLVFIVLAINGLNWMMIDRQTDRTLEILADSDGVFQDMRFDRPPPFFQPLNMDRMRSSRFFIVRSDENGIVDVNTEQISSINSTTAESYALKVLQSGSQSGWMDGYKYTVKGDLPDRLTIFMDTSDQVGNFLAVLSVSSAIAFFCWLIVLVIVILLSGKVIRPVLAGMEKQKQFITNAGHEMKTPLAIIQSNNDTMSLIHGENKYNVHIRNQTKRMSILMSNLLTLAKLNEEIRLPVCDVNVSETANELIGVFADEARCRNLHLDIDIKPDIISRTNSDSLRQVLTILLDNAIKYTPENGSIHLSIVKDRKRIRIVSENTMNPDRERDPERFFERFYRGDAARTQTGVASGYGIGLSAARGICENLGGQMHAEYPTAESVRFTAKF